MVTELKKNWLAVHSIRWRISKKKIFKRIKWKIWSWSIQITENSLQELGSECKLSEERVRELGDRWRRLHRLRWARTWDTWVGPALWHPGTSGRGRNEEENVWETVAANSPDLLKSNDPHTQETHWVLSGKRHHRKNTEGHRQGENLGNSKDSNGSPERSLGWD